MIVTIFRSHLNQKTKEEYLKLASFMSKLAKTMQGYISHKDFIAQDGERVTIIAFDSEEDMKAWSLHPDHVEAKKKGHSTLFSDYEILTCFAQKEMLLLNMKSDIY